MLTSIELNGELSPNIDNPLNGRAAEFVDHLELEHDHAFFSFYFDYINPHSKDDIKFQYRLNNYIERWFSANQYANSVTYSRLEPGNYQFQVRSSVNGSRWSQPKTLDITIAQPPWWSLYAIIGYVVGTCLIVLYFWYQARERRKARQLIADNEARLTRTLLSSGDELWDWNVQTGELIRINPWKQSEFPKDNIRELSEGSSNIHPNDYKRVRHSLRAHLTNEESYYEIYRLRTSDNRWQWVLDQGTCVEFDQHNKPLRMSGTLKDISQLKATEEKLRLFQRSIETLSDGVFITDPGFNIIRVNEAFCQLTNHPQTAIHGKHLMDKQLNLGFSVNQLLDLKQSESLTTEVEYRTL